jgi:hypothetical protein
VARQRRFAGQVEAIGAPTADQFASATETLKAAGQFLKPSRGGRLGGSTAQEQQEGAAARQANPQVFQPASPGATSSVQDIAKLRKDLGIDDLIKGISEFRSMQSGGQFPGGGFETPQFEMPQFEMPEFEMPSFEQPNWEELISKALGSQQGQPETTSAGAAPTPNQVAAPTPNASRFTAGGINYNLSKTGGAGLGGKDVANLIKKGASTKTLMEFAKNAPRVSLAGQKALQQQGIKVTGSGVARAASLTSSASRAVAAAKPSGGGSGGSKPSGGGSGGSKPSGGGSGGSKPSGGGSGGNKPSGGNNKKK